MRARAKTDTITTTESAMTTDLETAQARYDRARRAVDNTDANRTEAMHALAHAVNRTDHAKLPPAVVAAHGMWQSAHIAYDDAMRELLRAIDHLHDMEAQA